MNDKPELTIWKLALGITDVQEVKLPAGAEILFARDQGDKVCIWFRCDPAEAREEPRTITIVGTGQPAPRPTESRYLGTAFLFNGVLVWHVFERTI